MAHDTNAGIPSGFGRRLKEERKRLKYSQTDIAEMVGIGRLAQANYETETTSPTVEYLSIIGMAGVDLLYLLFGVRPAIDELDLVKRKRIELRAFELLEALADKQSDGRISPASRQHLFHILQGMLTEMEIGNLQSSFDPLAFLSGVVLPR